MRTPKSHFHLVACGEAAFFLSAALGFLSPTKAAPIYAAKPKIGAATGVIYRLNDANADGDALDIGENRTFRSETGAGLLTDNFNGVAVGRSGTVYVIETLKGRVVMLHDHNNDGDAQDSNEASLYRNSSDEGLQLQLPQSLAVSQTYDPDSQRIIDVVYVVDVGLQAVIRLQDLDGDGDARSSDEACMMHHSSADNPLSALQIATTESGEIVAVNHNLQLVHGLIDLTGDCHTEGFRRETPCPPQLLFNEYHLIRNNAPPGPNMNEPYGIGVGSEDVMYVADCNPLGGEEGAKVMRLEDLDDDYTALGGTEGTTYKTANCGTEAFRTPGPVTVDERNLVYVGDLREGVVVLLVDTNADNDAQDLNECRLFANGMGSVVSLSAQLPPLPPPRIMFVSGIVDLGKEKDLFLPDGATREFKVMLFDDITNSRLPNTKIRCDSLSGCLECVPRVDRTDADGRLDFQVTRLGPPDDEALIVSTLGAHEIINVPALIPEEDNDLDDIPNSLDNCPDDFNPLQDDMDGDGLGDECDPCPNDLDLNLNSKVDLFDFKDWPGCLAGPQIAVGPLCVCMDADSDTDSDLADYKLFQTGFNP